MKSWMRFALVAAMALTLGACSSGGDGKGPDPVQDINDMMSKGFAMTATQEREINELKAQGVKLQSEGKTTEARAAFDKALAMLNALAEADRFNKSE